jgi:hypothetical protein
MVGSAHPTITYYVSREVREEIESTLFLPIESIDKLKSK